MPGALKAPHCHCGKPLTYAQCCGPYHLGAQAPDAQTLMRSRYSAYVLADIPYLLATWHPSTRPDSLQLPTLTWLGLSIRRYQQIDSEHALVEFIARSRLAGGSAQRLHELSRFLRVDGRWFYLDGEFP